jgi:multidrug transporter EmrE-like cation transporter
MWNVVIVIIGYLFFKDNINYLNLLGIVMALLSIYLLSIK